MMREADLVPDVISYSAAISACEKGGQWQVALGLLATMQEAALVPNVISYSAAISACEKCGQWQEALGLLATMQEADLVPNVISYNAAISACEKWTQMARGTTISGPSPGGMVIDQFAMPCQDAMSWFFTVLEPLQ